MLFIKDKDRFYFIESTKLVIDERKTQQMLIPENMLFFKAKNSKTVIAGDNFAALDALRYVSLPFPAQLSLPAIHRRVMPKLTAIIEELGRFDEEDNLPVFFFGKGDKAFGVMNDGGIFEMEDAMTWGWNDSYFRYALALTEGMPLMKRIQTVYKTVEKVSGTYLFPLIMMDTKNCKIQIVEEETE